MERDGALEPGRALRLLAQVSKALDAAHAKGVVHRDVKPSNILVVGGPGAERALLTDFGLAKQLSSGAEGVQSELIGGTLEYAAPEQMEGKDVDPRTDVYSLGCALLFVRHRSPAGHRAPVGRGRRPALPPELEARDLARAGARSRAPLRERAGVRGPVRRGQARPGGAQPGRARHGDGGGRSGPEAATEPTEATRELEETPEETSAARRGGPAQPRRRDASAAPAGGAAAARSPSPRRAGGFAGGCRAGRATGVLLLALAGVAGALVTRGDPEPPVASATPSPSPAPTPTPSPSPEPDADRRPRPRRRRRNRRRGPRANEAPRVEAAVQRHWRLIEAGNYARAYDRFAPELQNRAAAGQAGSPPWSATGCARSTRGRRRRSSRETRATARVVRLRTTAVRSGCNDWRGTYKLRKIDGAWRISKADLESRKC